VIDITCGKPLRAPAQTALSDGSRRTAGDRVRSWPGGTCRTTGMAGASGPLAVSVDRDCCHRCGPSDGCRPIARALPTGCRSLFSPRQRVHHRTTTVSLVRRVGWSITRVRSWTSTFWAAVALRTRRRRRRMGSKPTACASARVRKGRLAGRSSVAMCVCSPCGHTGHHTRETHPRVWVMPNPRERVFRPCFSRYAH
jgi:hypothetical protein